VSTAPPVAALDDAADASPADVAEPLVGLRRSSVFIPELESVRGIAILLVFVFHVDGNVRFPFSVVPSTPLALAFVRAGFTGVDLFFVLSGFLLSLPFLADGAGGKQLVVRDYTLRRALRILPLYYVAVAVGTVLSAKHLADLRGASRISCSSTRSRASVRS
jgi:peptidoglycan/LPS O-acetylase OafA/YrhL